LQDAKKLMAFKEYLQRIFSNDKRFHRRDLEKPFYADEMNDRRSFDRRKMHPLEGAGRSGWDYEQNRGYGDVYGNRSGAASIMESKDGTNFRGKGPKNYRRSDSSIRDDINDRLTEDHYVDATHIEVEVSDGEVVLKGTVEDRAAKRRAEDIAEAVTGVRHLENRLRLGR
jgi:hypothetical protein